jgi:aryl-alcohol dehydrogenase-like predicted oxidoreductase
MAGPSSAQPDTHASGLDTYHALGGNCVHLHGEGGETHSRIETGKWLARNNLRREFVVCTQICHEGWDEEAKQPIDRFTPAAVREDISTDLELIETDYIDLVYVDDRPGASFEPMIDALGREVRSGRVRAFGVRNWAPERIRAADRYARSSSGCGLGAVITTELALPVSTAPLWPGYIPFGPSLTDVVVDLGLVVLAHAGDMCIGQCLFGEEDSATRWRPEWVARWNVGANEKVVHGIKTIAACRGVTARSVSLAWMLSCDFPVAAIISVPDLVGPHWHEYHGGAQLMLDAVELAQLNIARSDCKLKSEK